MHPPGLRGTLNSVTSVLREERGDGDVRSGRDGREDTISRGCWSSPEPGGSLEGTPSEPPEGGSPVHTLPSCFWPPGHEGIQSCRFKPLTLSSFVTAAMVPPNRKCTGEVWVHGAPLDESPRMGHPKPLLEGRPRNKRPELFITAGKPENKEGKVATRCRQKREKCCISHFCLFCHPDGDQ